MSNEPWVTIVANEGGQKQITENLFVIKATLAFLKLSARWLLVDDDI